MSDVINCAVCGEMHQLDAKWCRARSLRLPGRSRLRDVGAMSRSVLFLWFAAGLILVIAVCVASYHELIRL
jgi:hypothetical protein